METKNTLHRLISASIQHTLLLSFSIFFLLQFTIASEQTSVTTAKDGQLFPIAASDGQGGVIVMWEDYRTGNDWDIYAQRLSVKDSTLWKQNGIPISIADSNQRRLRMTGNDSHAVIVWNDKRGNSSWDIYAQAVDFEGKVLWQKDGIPVCTNSADQSTQAIMSDGDGGAVFVWEDERHSSEFQDLYIQRINSAGLHTWKSDGIPVYTSESLQSNPNLIADGTSGFYVVWWDVIGYDAWHIMAYRLSLDSTPIWVEPIVVTPKEKMHGEPRVVADGEGGIIVVWQIYENFINDQLYAQRISSDGEKLWEESGIPICTKDGIQKNAAIVNDGKGGIIAVWRDERDIYSDLYMQRIQADGTIAWEKDGIPLCTVGGHQDQPFIVKSDNELFFIAWLDFRGDFGEKSKDAIYCQKIDISGNLLWNKDGVPVSTSDGEHFPPYVVSVGNGQCVVVWSNSNQDNGDIYLKRF